MSAPSRRPVDEAAGFECRFCLRPAAHEFTDECSCSWHVCAECVESVCACANISLRGGAPVYSEQWPGCTSARHSRRVCVLVGPYDFRDVYLRDGRSFVRPPRRVASRPEPITCESCGALATRCIHPMEAHAGMAFWVCETCDECTCGAMVVPAGHITQDGEDVHSLTGCVVAPLTEEGVR